MWIRFMIAVLLCTTPAYAGKYVYTVPVCSSSVGTTLTDGVERSMGLSVQSGAATTVFVASLDDCSTFTSVGGYPLDASSDDAAISINGKNDGDGRWCGILKTGSTCVNVTVNLIGN